MADFDEILARVNVRDILLDAGLEPIGNRIACPIHGGLNKTSFRFNDNTFICYACDAKGGLLDLIEHLHAVTRREAFAYLCKLAGIAPIEDKPGQRQKDQLNSLATKKRYPLRRYPQAYYEIADKFEFKVLHRHAFDVALRMARRAMKKGEMPLPEYYSKEQWYLYQLELLDPEIIRLNYELNEIKREGNQNVIRPKSDCCQRN